MNSIIINNKEYVINKCPCCGHQPQEDIDYLHPTYNGFEVYKDFESEDNFNYYNKKDNKFNKQNAQFFITSMSKSFNS